MQSKSAGKPHGFPKSHRLRRRSEFLRVQDTGRKFHTAHTLVFLVDEGSVAPCRLGITVSKKVGNAVVRNRVRRMIREVFRRQKAQLKDGLELVVIAKQSAAQVQTVTIQPELKRLFAFREFRR